MKYLQKINEFNSATGGNSDAITGGEVYNIPVDTTSSLTPNSIQTNVGTTDINHTLPNDKRKVQKQCKKSKIGKKILQKEEEEIEKKPVMNWNDYIKNNINNI